EMPPLVLDRRNRLYLRRYHEHEQRLAGAIRARAAAPVADLDAALLREGLNRLFPELKDASDWQRVAAAVAMRRRFCVISGGPGQGKAFTVVKILALLVEQAQRTGAALRIKLVAPTGKAAARLSESIRNARPTLSCSDAVKSAIPAEATTIHRCL